MHPIFLHRYILKIAETSVKVMFLRKWSDTPEMPAAFAPLQPANRNNLVIQIQAKVATDPSNKV